MVSPVERGGPTSGSLMARLRRPRTEERTRLAVVADPHLSTRAEGSSKLFEHTVESVEKAIADANGRNVDAMVCVGDITKDGEPWNYGRFDELLADLDAPFYAVPGNHDVPKDGDEHETMPVSAFADRYAPPGQGFPFHVRVGSLDLLGLNTAGSRSFLHDSHEGLVTDDQLAWLAERLPEVGTPVVLAHHNLPAMYGQLREQRDLAEPDMFVPPELRNPEPFIDLLNEHDVSLLFTGHLHMPSAAREGSVRELMVPTTCSFPQGYLLVEAGPEGTDVRFVPVTDFAGTVRAYRERSTDSVTARGLTGMAAARLAQFPLVEER
ncbi:metallophosphoesterase [Halorarum halophilum]|uniref:Metallophosphoesterase n=1 Tax=Halorarum halophilum TaxID=2743090 RepID=A0A7D5GB07_9EURY|nr:metallophosphoesterase [Halobaculum halophilum]QLG26972.1 metallophosphoesterase [Halobaculum halophilum]